MPQAAAKRLYPKKFQENSLIFVFTVDLVWTPYRLPQFPFGTVFQNPRENDILFKKSPSGDTNMVNIRKLETELWESADLLRAGSKLTSNQYCMPVLGLIFLRYAYSRWRRRS